MDYFDEDSLTENVTVATPVTWKRLNTVKTQHGNASKKQNHKTNLMLSSLNLKL